MMWMRDERSTVDRVLVRAETHSVQHTMLSQPGFLLTRADAVVHAVFGHSGEGKPVLQDYRQCRGLPKMRRNECAAV